jgi:hypothetical protein
MTFTGLGEIWPPFFSLGAVISSSKLNTTLTLLQVLISFKDRVSWALPFQVKVGSKLVKLPMHGQCIYMMVVVCMHACPKISRGRRERN